MKMGVCRECGAWRETNDCGKCLDCDKRSL